VATFSGQMKGDDSGTAYVDVSNNGLNLCMADGTEICTIKYSVSSEGYLYPYMIFGRGVTGGGDKGLIKKFSNGFWFGTSGQATKTGQFNAESGDYGFFVNITTGALYAVVGSSMKNLYTGDAIARFG
jgi:hypothetical protein